ncbi:MAG TPA: Tex family protein [Pseudogracilibacillus sp.]|nr:Tex family protein [Pseudogracilibacillus sp.]
MDHIIQLVAKELNKNKQTIKQVIELLEAGNTVPFIARYRKEATGGLDETEIKAVQDHWTYAVQLHERKEEVLRLIDEQGKLTDDLKEEITSASKLQRIEDLYRPYRQKRRTRATIAKEKGLEPLATLVWEQEKEDIAGEIASYFSEEHDLATQEDVLAGVNDIIAEWISDDATFREQIRHATWQNGILTTTVKNEDIDEKQTYAMYYDYEEPIRKLVSHRVLAINRGEAEDVLRVGIEPPEEKIIAYLQRKVIKVAGTTPVYQILEEAIKDGYKRLIQPAVEREVRNRLTEEAEAQAIDVFSENLRNLLLQPPLKGRMILSIDPAFRTGCKLAVVDETGKMHAIDVIFPTAPRNDYKGSEKIVLQLIDKHTIELIAIGNGTASRETEQFVAQVIEENKLDIPYIIVNEAGASVYSASDLAREEFPNLEVEERSAISIGRRVQDPLAELVKIDPKSIGVGQYQHDVSQKELTESLNFVVETAVNQVGVNVNTASSSLLEHVAGLTKTTANNIIELRHEIGKFTNRKQLKKVARLGPKTYEQSIGFLRVVDGEHPLDQTPIHPESYEATLKLLTEIGVSLDEVGSEELREKLANLNITEMAEVLEIGVPTLTDIVEALRRPGRDMRDDFPQPVLKQKVLTLEDLEQGMELEGTVRNVVDFGAFVDIGVGQDGLVHISKLANHFVKHPMDVVAVGDVVTVWIEDVDAQRGRVALTMIQ